MKAKKIGIITLYGQLNYGNRLQNFALQEALASLGCEAETIVYHSSYGRDPLSRAKKLLRQPLRRSAGILAAAIKRKLLRLPRPVKADHLIPASAKQARAAAFAEFGRNIHLTSYTVTPEKFNQELAKRFDLFVVGSDQVWNPYSRGTRIEFLRFAHPQQRLSYAASFGVNSIPLRLHSIFRAGLSGMESISVREQEGAAIVHKLTGRQVPVHLDPTMLLDASVWNTHARTPAATQNQPYMLSYFLGDLEQGFSQEFHQVSQKEGWAFCRLNDPGDTAAWQAGPQDFLGYIRDARLILTDSFHGVVFCVLFSKQFFVFRRKGETSSGFSRITTLLNLLGLSSRIIQEGQSFDIATPIDYSAVISILDVERGKAFSYLTEVLHG